MRRDSNDAEWKKVKEIVSKRDNNMCRLIRILTYKEALILKKNAGSFINRLDHAHFISVSQDSSIMYDENNICLLNRYSHSNLDSCRDPITGDPITLDQVKDWWIRILKGNKNQYKYLESKGLLGEQTND